MSSTTISATPTELASSASSSGWSWPAGMLGSGSGGSAPADSSRRDRRASSMSRRTRATSVVSHPAGFSTWPVSAPGTGEQPGETEPAEGSGK